MCFIYTADDPDASAIHTCAVTIYIQGARKKGENLPSEMEIVLTEERVQKKEHVDAVKIGSCLWDRKP